MPGLQLLPFLIYWVKTNRGGKITAVNVSLEGILSIFSEKYSTKQLWNATSEVEKKDTNINKTTQVISAISVTHSFRMFQ